MVLIRVYVGSAAEYRKAVDAQKSGDIHSAVVHYGRSIKFYAPLSPWVKRSLEALWDIGTAAYDKGDYEMARLAIETLRSSLYAARGPFTPFKEQIKRADSWLSTHIPEMEPRAEKEEIAQLFGMMRGPNRLWSILVGVGFLGWILSVFAFIFVVFPIKRGGEIGVKRTTALGFLVILFYFLWIIGLCLA
jgi:hypothetical protein